MDCWNGVTGRRPHEAFVDHGLQVTGRTGKKFWQKPRAKNWRLPQLVSDASGCEVEAPVAKDLFDQIRWVGTSVMLVDALTKDMSGNQLRSCLKKRHLALKADVA